MVFAYEIWWFPANFLQTNPLNKKCETHHVDNGWVCPKTRLFSQPFADCSMRLVLSIVINLLSLVFCVQSSFQQQNEKRRPSERRVILQSRQPERSQAVDAEATDQPWLGHCNGFVSPFIWSLGFLLFFFSGLKQMQVNDCIYGPINREPNRTLNDFEAYHGVICLPS